MTVSTDAQRVAITVTRSYLDEAGIDYKVKADKGIIELNGICLTSDDHTDGCWLSISSNGWIKCHCHHSSCKDKAQPPIVATLNRRRRKPQSSGTAQASASSGSDKPSGLFRLYSITDFANRPIPPYVVDGRLTLDSTNGLTGESGSGKSLYALDLALSTAYGVLTIDGQATRQGHVVYIVGEGINGLLKRIQAWKKARGIEDDSDYFHLILDPLILTDDCTRVRATLDQLPEPPVLVVIDTLNRTFAGNENDATDMTAYIKSADRIRDDTGCCVLIVHHHGKDNNYRGSSAFKASLDTMLEVNRTGAIVTLSCTKQKDLEPFDPIDFRLRTVSVDGLNPDAFTDLDLPLFFSDLTSVVLEPVERRTEATAIDLTPKQLEALTALADLCVDREWVPRSEWQASLQIGTGTFSEAVKVLDKHELIETSKRGGPKNGRSFATVTADGWRYLKRSEATEPGPQKPGSDRTSTKAA